MKKVDILLSLQLAGCYTV